MTELRWGLAIWTTVVTGVHYDSVEVRSCYMDYRCDWGSL